MKAKVYANPRDAAFSRGYFSRERKKTEAVNKSRVYKSKSSPFPETPSKKYSSEISEKKSTDANISAIASKRKNASPLNTVSQRSRKIPVYLTREKNDNKKAVSRTEKIKIDTEYIKLGAFLKLSGASSTGGEAKNVIADGDVSVNGEVCTQRGKKLRIGDRVTVHGGEYEVI